MWRGDALFVSGTDTDVGKTVVAACLAAARARSGERVRALKPVASGVAPGTPGGDAALLGLAAGHAPASLHRFAAPLSPHRAAALEGVSVDPAGVRAWIAANRGDATLVEGAGGWHAPLGAGWRVSDLAVALGWPVLVVAADRLGCLNHALLTVDAVRGAGLSVAGVVLTGPPPPRPGADPDPSPRFNEADLAELLPGTPLGRVPWLPDLEPATLAAAGRALLGPSVG